MTIPDSGLYVNNTSKYLIPILNAYGKTFINQIGKLTDYVKGNTWGSSINCYAIADTLYYRAKKIKELKPYIFLVVDTRGFKGPNGFVSVKEGRDRFWKYMEYITRSNKYEDSYWIGPNKHCIVLSIEENFHHAFYMFVQSKYSKMYTPKQLEMIGITDKKDPIMRYSILTGRADAIDVLAREIRERWDTDVIPDNPSEYALPWLPEHEVLNHQYKKEGEII